jgi:hypothetical protein
MPSSGLLAIFVSVLGCLCMPAHGQTVFDIGPASRHRHVIELPMGKAHAHHHPLFPWGSGFHYPKSHSLIYLVHVLPGEYSIILSYPVGHVVLAPVVSVFDRWPYDALARRYDLPTGPTVRTQVNKVEYRWGVGISPLSTSTLLYLTVEVRPGSQDAFHFPHTISVVSPPSKPLSNLDRGVTFLSGPPGLVLSSGQGAVSYIVERPESTFDTEALPEVPIPGDLVRNGAFRNGLNHWVPHRDYVASDEVQSFALQDRSLRLSRASGVAREGLLQRIDADVSGATSLILSADVKVTEQTLGGTGPAGRDAPVAIAIGYADAAGREAQKEILYWKGFYYLSPVEPNRDDDGQKVPRGAWYRYMVDLTQLEPRPAVVLFLSLEGSGWPVREGWVREVHLIRTGGRE